MNGRPCRRLAAFAAGLAAAGLFAAPVAAELETPGDEPVAGVEQAVDEPAPEPTAGLDAGTTRDPWEGFNRKMFSLNMKLDRWFLEPAAKGWNFVVPEVFQIAIRNVYDNGRFPIIFLNDVLQLKPKAAAQDVGRFVLNSTVGLAGIFDAAKEAGWEGNDEDFGQTLGYWGVPPGPYLVLPFFGPSSPRDTAGMAADAAANFGAWFAVGIPVVASVLIGAGDTVNRRSLLLEEIDAERKAAFDFYVFVRNAHIQNRARRVRDAAPEPEPERDEDDLYFFDEEEEDDLYFIDEEDEEGETGASDQVPVEAAE